MQRFEFQPSIYILASGKYGTLYIGVTSNLMKRLYQHRSDEIGGFTAQHDVKKLMWYEQFGTMELAIAREKQLKRWHRDWKTNLIEQDNPGWIDLAVGLGFDPV